MNFLFFIQGYPPLINGYSVYVHSRDQKKVRALLNEPNVIDWSQRVGFMNIRVPDSSEEIFCQNVSAGRNKSELRFRLFRGQCISGRI